MTDYEKMRALTGLVDGILHDLWRSNLMSNQAYEATQNVIYKMIDEPSEPHPYQQLKDIPKKGVSLYEKKGEPHPVGSHDRQGDWL